jgi:hypothetical protein
VSKVTNEELKKIKKGGTFTTVPQDLGSVPPWKISLLSPVWYVNIIVKSTNPQVSPVESMPGRPRYLVQFEGWFAKESRISARTRLTCHPHPKA